MTPEQVLAQPPRVLSQAQREAYFTDGYLLVERLIPAAAHGAPRKGPVQVQARG